MQSTSQEPALNVNANQVQSSNQIEPVNQTQLASNKRWLLLILTLLANAALVMLQVFTSTQGLKAFLHSTVLSAVVAVSLFCVMASYFTLWTGSLHQRVFAFKLTPIIILALVLDGYTSAIFLAEMYNKDAWRAESRTAFIQDAERCANRIVLEYDNYLSVKIDSIETKKREMNAERTGNRQGHAKGQGKHYELLAGEVTILIDEETALKKERDAVRAKFSEALAIVAGKSAPSDQEIEAMRTAFNTVLRRNVPATIVSKTGAQPMIPLVSYNDNSQVLWAFTNDLKSFKPGAWVAIGVAFVLELLIIALSLLSIVLSQGRLPNLFRDCITLHRETQKAAHIQKLDASTYKERIARERAVTAKQAELQQKEQLLEADTQRKALEVTHQQEKERIAREYAVAAKQAELQQKKQLLEADTQRKALEVAHQQQQQQAEMAEQSLIFLQRGFTAQIARKRASLQHDEELTRLTIIANKTRDVRDYAALLRAIWKANELPFFTAKEWNDKLDKVAENARNQEKLDWLEDGDKGRIFCLRAQDLQKEGVLRHFLAFSENPDYGLVQQVHRPNQREPYFAIQQSVVWNVSVEPAQPEQKAANEDVQWGKLHSINDRRIG